MNPEKARAPVSADTPLQWWSDVRQRVRSAPTTSDVGEGFGSGQVVGCVCGSGPDTNKAFPRICFRIAEKKTSNERIQDRVAKHIQTAVWTDGTV